MTTSSKPLVIYHANCADGFGAAFAAWLHFRDGAEYLAADHKDKVHPEDWINRIEGRDVYILDFSFPKPVMELALTHASKLIWLDHHKSAFELWTGGYQRGMLYTQSQWIAGPELDEIVDCHIELDDTRSGALIAWDYFHHHYAVGSRLELPGRPMLFSYLDDYDRWQHKIDGTKAFNAALRAMEPWSFEQWHTMLLEWGVLAFGATSGYHKTMLADGRAILRAHDQHVADTVEHCARPCFIIPPILSGTEAYSKPWGWDVHTAMFGAPGLAANCPPNLINDVGHALAKLSGTYGLIWQQGKDDQIRVSLRSNGNCDVSAIAKKFGGGGHEKAAGFHTTMGHIQGWVNFNSDKE